MAIAVSLLWFGAAAAANAGEVLPVSASASTPVAARTDSSCDIIGTVADLKKVSRSPFTDGAPSTIIITETHISVTVHNRRPHNAALAGSCNVTPKNEVMTYKLCSSAQPQQGDKIMATEAGNSGGSSARCLFDLQIMPRTSASATLK
ncbi:MAG: hypothetical protein PW788_15840 [Micavibrio sp.]|nr:hypothetical protein [Micavibrio sp.]